MSSKLSLRPETHLRLICEVHKELAKCPSNVGKTIKNNTGKSLEEYKVYIKRLERYLQNEKHLKTERTEEFLKRAKSSVEKAYGSNYINLLRRSMDSKEICVKDSIPLEAENLEDKLIINIEDCCYDMIEMDGIYYLAKLKKKSPELDWNKLVKIYCEEESLDQNSEKYMLSVLSFPREFFKCFERYRLNKRQWTEEEFQKHLKKAIEKDGNSLI